MAVWIFVGIKDTPEFQLEFKILEAAVTKNAWNVALPKH